MAKFVVLCSLLLVAANCTYDPCADKGSRAAWIAGGGPIGAVAALALSCAPPEPEPAPEPIGAVPPAGLVEQPPDMGAAPDLATVPDLAELHCGVGQVIGVTGTGAQFCEPDTDGDGIADRLDKCPSVPSGQTPDPSRRGCPKPRSYQVVLPPAAFSAGGNVTVHDGVASSLPSFDWINLKHTPATLTSIVFFQNAAPNVTNAVSFQLDGTADFTAPVTTASACTALANRGQDAVTRPPNDIACIARRLDICPVNIVSPASKLFGESECARTIGGGGGFSSKANAPVTLTASVPAGDFNSSNPQPVSGIEIQILLSGTMKLAGWQVIATVTETIK